MNIKKVMICGGTHGNELSGVYAVKHWMEHPDKLKGHITSAKLDFLLVNQASIDARVRYLDEDLNRQFDLQKLIDIHNTTSAMGPTLIVLDNDDFTRNLARFVKQAMPEANILVEDHIAYREHPYFCTLAKRSVMVEVGPQAQGRCYPHFIGEAAYDGLGLAFASANLCKF